jgi:hypothetical protein
VVKELEQLVTETIFPRIYARTYYAQGCARIMSFSDKRSGRLRAVTDAPLRNKCFLDAVSEHQFHIRWRCGCPRALNRRGADGISVA